MKLWFKRRRYGYGWVPVTKEGWMSVVLFLAIIFTASYLIKDVPENEFNSEVGAYLLIVILSVGQLILVAIARGPKPKWRFGKSEDDDPREDF